jgi:hypothetical protein
MLSFLGFLVEAAGKSMSGNFNSIKTPGHIDRYVLPFLNKEQKQKSVDNVKEYMGNKKIDTSSHGELHNPDENATTHTLASAHKNPTTGESVPKGTAVKVTGVHAVNGIAHVTTQNHGTIPMSKLGTPEALAAKPKTSVGLGLEHVVQKNADPRYKPAGTSGGAWDFVAGNPDSKMSIRGKAAKKDESAIPEFRGESKASKKGAVAMGTSTINYDKGSKKWSFANPKMAEAFGKAVHPASGKPLLDHLNEHHADGRISKGFSIDAAPGTTHHYLEKANANALHLHRYGQDSSGNFTHNHGTTYTVGKNNPFANKLGMAHLSHEDLGALDGKLHIEATRGDTGVTQVKHRPKPAVFNSYADASQKEPEKHTDLSNTEHGNKFREKFKSAVSSMMGHNGGPSINEAIRKIVSR